MALLLVSQGLQSAYLLCVFAVASSGVSRAAQPPPPRYKCDIQILTILMIKNLVSSLLRSELQYTIIDNCFSSKNFHFSENGKRISDRFSKMPAAVTTGGSPYISSFILGIKRSGVGTH